MSVLLLTDADVFAGTERHILALAIALTRQRISVQIGCPVPSPLAEQAAAARIGVIPIAKRGLIDRHAARQLRGLVKSGQVKIVHAHNGRTCLAAAIGLWGTRGRLVASQHFLHPAHTRRRGPSAMLSRILHHWMRGRVNRYIAVSQAVADAMRTRDHLDDDRVTVVHNGLAGQTPQELTPPDQVRAQLQIDPQTPLIVCAARLESEKDVASLIAAMQIVTAKFPAARCVIAGKGSLHDSLLAQINQARLQDHLRLLGFRDDVPALMNAGDCFVLPSLAEPFGLVLLEAMALNKPVVATRLAGPLEIVQDGVTGLLVPPSDPAALAEAIMRLIRDPHAAAEMGRQGRARFESHFTDDRMAAATAAVYRTLVNSI